MASVSPSKTLSTGHFTDTQLRADIKTLIDMARNKLRGHGITDDKTMIMERVIALVADLPHQSRLREELTNTLLNELWHSLEHPPLLYVGDEFQFRTADGSNNVCYEHIVHFEFLALTRCRTLCARHSVPRGPPTRGRAARGTSPSVPSRTPSRCSRA